MINKLNESPNFKPNPDKDHKNLFERIREAFS